MSTTFRSLLAIRHCLNHRSRAGNLRHLMCSLYCIFRPSLFSELPLLVEKNQLSKSVENGTSKQSYDHKAAPIVQGQIWLVISLVVWDILHRTFFKFKIGHLIHDNICLLENRIRSYFAVSRNAVVLFLLDIWKVLTRKVYEFELDR